MQKRRVVVNALVSVLQVVVNGVVFLVLYRFLIGTLGYADVGVWSVVLAWASVSNLANLGMVGSALKFVAAHRAGGEDERAADVVQTTVVSVAVILGVVLAAAYVPLHALLETVVNPADKVPIAQAILPYALGSFWLMSVGGVLGSGIEGCERVDLRQVLTMGSAGLYLGLAFAFVPERGLVGLALAQVLQAAAFAASTWIVLRRLLPTLPLLPVRWRWTTFREVLGYAVNFQVVTVAQLLLDPVARSLVSLFGGATAAGLFETAYKMVFQLRLLIATAHQAIVPTLAVLHVQAPERLRAIYVASFRLILLLVLTALPLLLALSPAIFRLWLGDAYDPALVVYASILGVGWFLNLLANPAYFANLGTGDLRWNVRGTVFTGVANAVGGYGLGMAFGGLGVAVAYAAAVLVGSALIPLGYGRDHGIPVRTLAGRDTALVAAAAGAGLAVTAGLHRALEAWHALPLALLLAAVYLAVVAVPLWRHPMRAQLLAWLGDLRSPRPQPSPLERS